MEAQIKGKIEVEKEYAGTETVGVMYETLLAAFEKTGSPARGSLSSPYCTVRIYVGPPKKKRERKS